MKFIVTTILIFFSLAVFGQNIDSCGVDNNAKLTLQESKFLNNYLLDLRLSFDFTGKQIIFVTNPSGERISTKTEYFSEIKNWNTQFRNETILSESNKKIATTLIILSEKEKIESGGYDAILTYWVKVVTESRKKKIIEEVKSK
ncbi:MAG: hypothetical protein RLZZ175_3301 [Bacteroidota bacterium]|jgi:hypothetical protein